MAKPVWITPTGSLGVIPEGVFFQQALRAGAAPLSNQPTCTTTDATTNIITCNSTTGIYAGLQVQFVGTTFGGLSENTRYFVFQVLNSTQFTIANTEYDTAPRSLTTGSGSMLALFSQFVEYSLIAGSLPAGIQLGGNGLITGVPQAVASLQGVPTEVSTDVTSKFAIRGLTRTQAGAVDGIADRTFSLTVTGNDVPEFVTPAGNIGTYYDGDYVELQVVTTNADPADSTVVTLISGQLPLGLRIDQTGLITGFIRPAPNEDQPVGYDETPSGTVPYDFVSSAISKNYQFTLEVSDSKSSTIRTFTIFVYNRADLTADDTYITADNTFVTADQTPERYPFLLNFDPSNLGRVRSDNNFAYRFIGQDYDNEPVRYAFSVNQGFGSPPGLALDPASGWYYGFIPDQGVTELEYSFNITVYQANFVGTAITCTATTGGTNVITCSSTAQLAIGQPIVFTGTAFGGITAAPTTVYYVYDVFGALGTTQFKVATSPTATQPVTLTTASGTMQFNLVVASQPYPFTIIIAGDIDSEVSWISPSNLGEIENGDTSVFQIQAVNSGGRELSYRLKDGAFNELPQGLTLLPTGEIAGRVTFNTFAIDLGATTFDASQSNVAEVDPTTFDSTFVFTVNAYAEDTEQPLYALSEVLVTNGGTGFSTEPTITFATPLGADAEQATVTATVNAGAITAVTVTDAGAGYTTDNPSYTIVGAGSGAVLTPVMQQTGNRDVISVFKTFTIRVVRAYNKPYQNLFVLAMPPQNDRELLNSLLSNQNIFIPSAIYRPDDPNFGLSTRVKYQHAFGLAPETFETYVSSLYLNHYWKNLVLGPIGTAQAVDPGTGQVIYEVVYSQIVDDLVNNQGQSVSKIVTLPYAIVDPIDGSTLLTTVYPNSLVNMRDQVIDVVGQISNKLPLWMTSKQTNGRVLGFTPAWVICYTKPGQSRRIAYYIDSEFGVQLNKIDFKVDRYVLDSTLSKNWDPVTQNWTPEPNQTTFDRVDTEGYADLGIVNACTELAFADVNGRTVDYINSLGGLDGPTWIQVPGQTPPVGTTVTITNGSKIVFVKQEAFIGPNGSVYDSVDDAFTDYIDPYDSVGFDSAASSVESGSFDYSVVVNAGYSQICSATVAATDTIRCNSTVGMTVGDKVWFTGSVFGNIQTTNSGFVQVYYVIDITDIVCTATTAGTNRISTSGIGNLNSVMAIDDQVWFTGSVFGNVNDTEVNGLPRAYYVVDIPTATQFVVSETQGGAPVSLSTAAGSMSVIVGQFQISTTPGGSALALSNDSGDMTVNYGNDRMAIYTVSIDAVSGIVNLALGTQTVTDDYVSSSQGQKYTNSTLLYRPAIPQQSLTFVNWQPLITATTLVSNETIFDGGSVSWVEPVDMYDPTDALDKYMVFPKTNILV